MRICRPTTGSQQAPAMPYSTIAANTQPESSGNPAILARTTPVTACTTIAGVVNSQSAHTTRSPTTRIALTLPLPSAVNLKNAVPSPVPNRTVALTTCSTLIHR